MSAQALAQEDEEQESVELVLAKLAHLAVAGQEASARKQAEMDVLSKVRVVDSHDMLLCPMADMSGFACDRRWRRRKRRRKSWRKTRRRRRRRLRKGSLS